MSPVEDVTEIPWYHSIDLPGGTTKGVPSKSPEILARELRNLDLPDLTGKSVLDIGAWDGYFSFACERLGAARVVSLDYHSWGIDRRNPMAKWTTPDVQNLHAYEDYWERPGVFDFTGLPGRKGYDYAHRELGSSAEPVVGDFMTMDLAALGSFDVVLFLGVLYHLKHPLLGLERLRSITNDVAIIETEGVSDTGTYAKFIPGAELNEDPTNWWVPTEEALVAMCRTAGFSKVDIKVGPPSPPKRWKRIRKKLRRPFAPPSPPAHYRGVVQAFS